MPVSQDLPAAALFVINHDTTNLRECNVHRLPRVTHCIVGQIDLKLSPKFLLSISEPVSVICESLPALAGLGSSSFRFVFKFSGYGLISSRKRGTLPKGIASQLLKKTLSITILYVIPHRCQIDPDADVTITKVKFDRYLAGTSPRKIAHWPLDRVKKGPSDRLATA